MHEVLVNRFGGLSLSMKSVARLTDHKLNYKPTYVRTYNLCLKTTIIGLWLSNMGFKSSIIGFDILKSVI